MLAAPIYVPLLLYGQDNVSAGLVVTLTRILFPIVAVLGMTGVVTGILNSERIFGLPAFAPVVWNLVIIVGLVGFARGKPLDEGVQAYAVAVLLATIVQFLIPLPLLRGHASGLAWQLGFGNPEVRRILRLMLPVSIGLGLININLTLDTIIAVRHSEQRGGRPQLRLPPVHAAAGTVLGRGLDGAVPRAGAPRRAARPAGSGPDRRRRRAHDRLPAAAGRRDLDRAGDADRAAALPARALHLVRHAHRLAGADGVLAGADRKRPLAAADPGVLRPAAARHPDPGGRASTSC